MLVFYNRYNRNVTWSVYPNFNLFLIVMLPLFNIPPSQPHNLPMLFPPILNPPYPATVGSAVYFLIVAVTVDVFRTVESTFNPFDLVRNNVCQSMSSTILPHPLLTPPPATNTSEFTISALIFSTAFQLGC